MKSMIKRLLTSVTVLLALLFNQNISAQTKSSSENSDSCPDEWIGDCNIKVKEHADILLIVKPKVRPNPSGGFFILQLSGVMETNTRVRVMDTQGRVLFTSYGSAHKTYRFGDNFVAGLYFVQVILNNKPTVLRVTKL